MRRALLLLSVLAGCGFGPTAVGDSQITVRVARRIGMLTISNVGLNHVTFVALDRETYNRVDLSPCESWSAIAAGSDTTVPITTGSSEMVVTYCTFAVPRPARPTNSGTLSVPVR